jgi:cell division GTPase FtsZ
MMTMDDLAKIQMFLSEYINPKAEVTWEYGVDDSLKNNQMRLTLVLG